MPASKRTVKGLRAANVAGKQAWWVLRDAENPLPKKRKSGKSKKKKGPRAAAKRPRATEIEMGDLAKVIDQLSEQSRRDIASSAQEMQLSHSSRQEILSLIHI